MYEYVKKSEYAPARAELEEIIKRVQIEMWKKHRLRFQFWLIGSGQRHLITRVRGGNGGYDFDYNLIVPHPGNAPYDARKMKQNFMAAFQAVLQVTQYSSPKDSTSAITIKVVDQKEKKLCHSCDFAIVYYGNCGQDSGYYYLRNNKNGTASSYEFAFRPLEPDISKKVRAIRSRHGWRRVRAEYLTLKANNRDHGKHSFSIYIEAVNNGYNQMLVQ